MAKIGKRTLTAGSGTQSIGKNTAELEKQNAELKKIAPVQIPVETIVEDDEFKAAWSHTKESLAAIADDMAERGYDETQPLIAWKCDGDTILLDGHGRKHAAKQNGIKTVPVRILPQDHFSDREEVLSYIYTLQTNRRNLTDAEQFRHLLRIDISALPYKGKAKDKLAKHLHKSASTAAKFNSVLKNGEQYHQAILDGEMSINQAYDLIHPKEKPQQKTPTESPSQTTGGSTETETDDDLALHPFPSDEEETETGDNSDLDLSGPSSDDPQPVSAKSDARPNKLAPPQERDDEKLQIALSSVRNMLAIELQGVLDYEPIMQLIVDIFCEQTNLITKSQKKQIMKELS